MRRLFRRRTALQPCTTFMLVFTSLLLKAVQVRAMYDCFNASFPPVGGCQTECCKSECCDQSCCKEDCCGEEIPWKTIIQPVLIGVAILVGIGVFVVKEKNSAFMARLLGRPRPRTGTAQTPNNTQTWSSNATQPTTTNDNPTYTSPFAPERGATGLFGTPHPQPETGGTGFGAALPPPPSYTSATQS